MTVVKPRAWMINQRQRRQACNPFVRGERVVDLRTESLCMEVSAPRRQYAISRLTIGEPWSGLFLQVPRP